MLEFLARKIWCAPLNDRSDPYDSIDVLGRTFAGRVAPLSAPARAGDKTVRNADRRGFRRSWGRSGRAQGCRTSFVLASAAGFE